MLALLGAGSDLTAACLLLTPQLGGSAGHHRGSCGSEEDRLRRLGRVGGLVLDQPGGGGPGAVDAADREAVGAAGLRHSARALPPHPEAHPPGGRCPGGPAQSSVWPVCPRNRVGHLRGRTSDRPE